ncbi:MAG: Fe-S metabolism protein SufE [Sulfurimonas sp.]|nr:MAG: Fe-S metabolism protein SufE [Sulfurimonas sp.]
MKIKQEIKDLVSEFEMFDDIMDRYEYIIELGKALKPLELRYKTEIYRVQGCQSLLWLHAYVKNGKLYLNADGDALIVRGLVGILIRIYSTRDIDDILETKISDLEVLGLSEIISSGRQNGIASMLKIIYESAKDFKNVK